MPLAYYANYVDGHHGSHDRIGGLPSHLPPKFPRCDCGRDMAFLAQIYFAGKKLEFVEPNTIAIQLYACDECCENGVVEIDLNCRENTESLGTPMCQNEYQKSNLYVTYSKVTWDRFTRWCDIQWTEKSDPEPTADIEQFWLNGDELRPEYEDLLEDKIGGCFPIADHGGTPAVELGIVAQLTIDGTVYITKADDTGWGFFYF